MHSFESKVTEKKGMGGDGIIFSTIELFHTFGVDGDINTMKFMHFMHLLSISFTFHIDITDHN